MEMKYIFTIYLRDGEAEEYEVENLKQIKDIIMNNIEIIEQATIETEEKHKRKVKKI